MRLVRWGLGALGVALASGAVAFGAMSYVGSANAQTPPTPKLDDLNSRYQDALAQQLGISVDQLQTAETTARNQIIDQELQAGHIDAAQADKLKSLPAGLGAFGPMLGGAGERRATIVQGGENILAATASILGLQESDVQTALKNGQSLADLAQSNGMDRATFRSKLLATLQDQVQQAVTDGKIDQSMADKLTASIESRIDMIIDSTHAGGDMKFGPFFEGAPPSGKGSSQDGPMRPRMYGRDGDGMFQPAPNSQ